ncbi:MAG TPA: hypothetical protein VFJ85_19910 [Acidimicrobiales bacterium]|nr:hypothetical protein [Acidimicrobiales bacterium]
MPTLGLDRVAGSAIRTNLDWHEAVWDLSTAAIGVYYWSLRRTYGPLMRGAKLFDDLRERQRQALQINDEIVQGLSAAHLALLLDEKQTSQEALEHTLVSARDLISDLLGSARLDGRPRPGDLLRDRPARPVEDAGAR